MQDMTLVQPLTIATEPAKLHPVQQEQQSTWHSPCSRRLHTMRLLTHSYRTRHLGPLSGHRSRQRTIHPMPHVGDSHATPLVTGHGTLGLPRELHAGTRGVVSSMISVVDCNSSVYFHHALYDFCPTSLYMHSITVHS